MSEISQGITASAPGLTEEQLRIIEELFGRDWVKDFDDPILFRSYTLTSKAATRFYLRNFAAMSHFLFAEVIYRRRPDFDDAMLNDFVVEVGKKLTEVQSLLVTHSQRLRKLCESNGHKADAAYVHSQQLLVPIIAAHATSYMRCLVKLDELFQLTGSATLCGVINSYERKTIELTARRAMRLLHRLIRHEYSKLRTESERLLALPAIPDVRYEDSERLDDDRAHTVDCGERNCDVGETCKAVSTAPAIAPGPSEGQRQQVLPEGEATAETMSSLCPSKLLPDAAIAQ